MINLKITVRDIEKALDRENIIASFAVPNEFKRLTYNPSLARFTVDYNKDIATSEDDFKYFKSLVDSMMFFNNIEIG